MLFHKLFFFCVCVWLGNTFPCFLNKPKELLLCISQCGFGSQSCNYRLSIQRVNRTSPDIIPGPDCSPIEIRRCECIGSAMCVRYLE